MRPKGNQSTHVAFLPILEIHAPLLLPPPGGTPTCFPWTYTERKGLFVVPFKDFSRLLRVLSLPPPTSTSSSYVGRIPLVHRNFPRRRGIEVDPLLQARSWWAQCLYPRRSVDLLPSCRAHPSRRPPKYKGITGLNSYCDQYTSAEAGRYTVKLTIQDSIGTVLVLLR